MHREIFYLIGQIIVMDNIAHHPNRLVKRTKFIIPVNHNGIPRYIRSKIITNTAKVPEINLRSKCILSKIVLS